MPFLFLTPLKLLIRQRRQLDYVGVSRKFITVDEIRQAIEETCESIIEVPLRNMGPGHGAKGKQRWLITDADVAEMYKAHEGKKEILL